MVTSTPLSTDPPPHVYQIWKLFTMPTDGGGITAVAVPDWAGAYFVSVYTIILGSIFAFGWQFLTYLIITFYPTEDDSRIWTKKSRKGFEKDGTGTKSLLSDESLEVRRNKANRYIALVSVWNTTDPASAMLLLMEHAYIMCTTVGDQMTGLLDVIVLLLTAGFMISAGIARVIISSSLLIGNDSALGNVAPINPSSVYYWSLNLSQPLIEQQGEAIRYYTFGKAAAMRAAGASESITEEVRKKVTVIGTDDDSATISWAYNISGVEFGLQHASEILYSVQGTCALEYRWIDITSSQGDATDTYYHPDLRDNVTISLREDSAPTALSLPLGDAGEQQHTGNYTFMIVFKSAGRFSYYPGNDPMYMTREQPDPGAPPYLITRGRPSLVCWEKRLWAYKDIVVNDVNTDIEKIPDKVLPQFFKDEFIPGYFGTVTYPILVRALGGAVLWTSSSSGDRIIDAGVAKWKKDMAQLYLLNYLWTRNAFRDSALMTDLIDGKTVVNSARLPDGNPKPGLGEIVISTSQVTTMSLAVLIIIPVVWILVWVIISVFRCNRWTNRNSGKASRFTLRAVGLQAVQMYRLLDEEVCGNRDDWENRKTHMPYILKAKNPTSEGPRSIRADSYKMDGPTVGSDMIMSSPPLQQDTPPLFSAPKVVKDARDNRHHLKFTGPLAFEPKIKEKSSWTWKEIAGGPRLPEREHPVVTTTSTPDYSDIPGIDESFNNKGAGR